MRYEKVLFINPPSKGEWKGFRPHIGLGYISQYLSENGIEYDILDMNLGYDLKHIIKKVERFQPHLIGISLLTLEYLKWYKLITSIKEAFPDIEIIAGGPHVTIFKQQVMEECQALDYAALYEGEDTMLELCQGDLPETEIKGLMSRQNGSIFYLGDREFAQLDKFPFPRYDNFELNKYIPEIEIYSSRGCPHECIFCPNRIINPKFRVRSPENVVDEISYWYEKGFRQFNFDDDNFNYQQSRVFDICDLIQQRHLSGLFIRCSNGIRADKVNREMLIRMKEVGFNYIAFGADAANNKMLKLVKKGETIEDIENALDIATELGYNLKLLFVVGTPGETREDVEDKVRLSLKYPLQDVHFYNIIPYPGTELYDWVKENNRFLEKPEQYLNEVTFCEIKPVFDTPELSAADRIEIFKYLEGVRKQVHKNAVTRIVKNHPLLSFFAKYLVTRDLFLKLFFANFGLRTAVDRIRYKLAVGSTSK